MASIYQISQEYRKELLQRDREAISALLSAYALIYENILREVDRLLLEAEEARKRGVVVGESWLRRQDRLDILRFQVANQIQRFSQSAISTVSSAQRFAIELALRESSAQINLAPQRAAVGISFNRVPQEALEALVGNLRNGSPLSRLFNQFPSEAAIEAGNTLIKALGEGKGPRETGRELRTVLQTPLSRATTISRTETLRVHRQAARSNYEANSDIVEGWIWTATKSLRTCPVCLAMDGTRHPLGEEMGSHPNCRCTQRPIIEGVLDRAEPARLWFDRLNDQEQVKVLGPKKQAAYKAKELSLMDLVQETDHPMWGPGLREKSLKAALLRRAA